MKLCSWCGNPAPNAVQFIDEWWHEGCAGRVQDILVRSENSPMRRLPVERERTDKCGTRAGYAAHRRRGEPPCAKCKAANAAYHVARRRGEAPA